MKYILILLISIITYNYLNYTSDIKKSNVLLNSQPIQENLDIQTVFQYKNDFTISKKAKYQVEAVVLSKEKYYMGVSADLIPYDIVLGWDKMTDNNILKNISITQSGRWYMYKYENVSGELIKNNSANTHIISANEDIEKKIEMVKEGDKIVLEGYLVDVDYSKNNDYWSLKSSMSRTDTGAGACEIFFVEKANIFF